MKLLMSAFIALNVWLYRVSGGRMMGSMGAAPILLLTTTGRRSRRERTVPVLYLEDGCLPETQNGRRGQGSGVDSRSSRRVTKPPATFLLEDTPTGGPQGPRRVISLFGREGIPSPFVIVIWSARKLTHLFFRRQNPAHRPDRPGGRASNQSNAPSSRRSSGARQSH